MADTELRQRLEQSLVNANKQRFLRDNASAYTQYDNRFPQKDILLEDLFYSAHNRLYRHRRSPNEEFLPAGAQGTGAKNSAVRQSLQKLSSQLFDENGFFKRFDKKSLGNILADTYLELSEIAPFDVGNENTLRLFYYMLFQLPDMAKHHSINYLANYNDYGGLFSDIHAVPGEKLRELRESELPEYKSLRQTLTYYFSSIIDNHAVYYDNAPRDPEKIWSVWPSSQLSVEGLKFLAYGEGGQQYFVTVNGGLVLKEKIETQLAEHLRGSGMIGDFLITPDQVERYLDPTVAKAENVDGYDLKKGAPLAGLSVHPLTSLSDANHTTLVRFLDYAKIKCNQGKPISLFDLSDTKLLASLITLEPGFAPVLRAAAEHIDPLDKKIQAIAENEVQGKHPTTPKRFCMSMGKGGAGKSGCEEDFGHLVGDNYVRDSLDDLRHHSPIYDLLKLCGHHNDDYKAVDQIAIEIRNRIAEEARKRGLNIFYDGSGLPYKKRYDTSLVNTFKDAGYDITVAATEAMLHIPKERKEEFGLSTPERIEARFDNPNIRRTFPWSAVLEKATQAGRGILDVMEDPNVDFFYIIDNAGKEKTAYQMAKMYRVSNETLEKMEHHQLNGSFLSALSDGEIQDVHGDPLKISASRNYIRDERNVGFLNFPVNGENRVLLIGNMVRMIDVIENDLLNPHASGPDALTRIHPAINFLMPSRDLPKGRYRTTTDYIGLQTPPKWYVEAQLKLSAERGAGPGK